MNIEIVINLLVLLAIGGIIGFEREWSLEEVKLKANAEKTIDKKIQHKYKKIMQAKSQIDSYNRKDLHRLRVKTKELMYILEILGTYTKHGKQERKLLKYLQNLLGKINDTYITEKYFRKMHTRGHDKISRSYIEQQALSHRDTYLLQLKDCI